MRNQTSFLWLVFGFSICNASPVAADAIANAAAKFHPAFQWQTATVKYGDFACRGTLAVAVLGTSDSEILVAVFVDGLSRKPHLLRYSTSMRSAEFAVLEVDSLDFQLEDFERETGPLPRGLQPSKTCLGLTVSDGQKDAAHIYWNRKDKRFQDWTR